MITAKFNLKKFVGIFFILQLLVISLSVFLPTTTALAATDTSDATIPIKFTPQISIPLSGFTKGTALDAGTYNAASSTMDSDLLARYIITIYNYGLAIVGILATIVLMGAGIIWLTSGGDAGKITQAKEMISGSIIGVVILVCAWIILNTINPNLTNLAVIKTVVITKTDINFLTCCDPTKGETKTPIKIVNGLKIATDGSLAGKEIKCGNDGECSSRQICIKSNDKYACQNNICGVILGSTCIEGGFLHCPTGYSSDLSWTGDCGKGRGCCHPNESKPDEQCGNRKDISFCYPQGTDASPCPKGMVSNDSGKCSSGYVCCYIDPKNKQASDSTSSWAECGKDIGAKCRTGGYLLNPCPSSGYAHSSGGVDCPTGSWCCYLKK